MTPAAIQKTPSPLANGDCNGVNGLKHGHLAEQQKNPVNGAKENLPTGGILQNLFSPSAEAKIWAVASRALHQPSPPIYYPEYTKPGGKDYVYRELDFWTSGFFPGSLFLLLERRRAFPYLFTPDEQRPHIKQLEYACQWWTENLHQNALLKGTHDLGFMILPWAKLDWELNQSSRSMASIVTAAETLASRFDATIGCIRSWDKCQTQVYNFNEPQQEFMVIIDNMMNLSLLFYASQHKKDESLRDKAIQHARTTARSHVRQDASTSHLIIFDPTTGNIRERLTNQGFSHDSCWARGQAWAIAGFAETHQWTGMEEFLVTARRCADYFLDHLPPSAVAPWDFDAFAQSETPHDEPPDTSASLIAAYGLLLIHRALTERGDRSDYLSAAMRLVRAVCQTHLTSPAEYLSRKGELETVEHGTLQTATAVTASMDGQQTIVNGATINNFQHAPRRWANHGLVYADYYFLLFGNELLKMNLGSLMGALW
ncbi:hypothetical protein S40288_09575 [Stachybotrys chartarum IBT 40288]|nr:hypothetical protein S40288_09575 [Stachybotrys chartarum IBT 40288]